MLCTYFFKEDTRINILEQGHLEVTPYIAMAATRRRQKGRRST